MLTKKKPHLKKVLQYAIKKRSRLKSKGIKSKYFFKYASNDSKQFWVNSQPNFNEHFGFLVESLGLDD